MGIWSTIASYPVEVGRVYASWLNRKRDGQQGNEAREAHLNSTALEDLTDGENENFGHVC